jgi:hypothetical protein
MNSEQLEEIKRHFSVVSEALRSDILRITEGQTTHQHQLQERRDENQGEFKEIQAFTQLSSAQFDQHIDTLETDISTMKNRMDCLEASLS